MKYTVLEKELVKSAIETKAGFAVSIPTADTLKVPSGTRWNKDLATVYPLVSAGSVVFCTTHKFLFNKACVYWMKDTDVGPTGTRNQDDVCTWMMGRFHV